MFLPFFFRLEVLRTCSTGKELRGASFKVDGRVARRVIEPDQKEEEEEVFVHRVFTKGSVVILAAEGVQRIAFSGARPEATCCQKLDHS